MSERIEFEHVAFSFNSEGPYLEIKPGRGSPVIVAGASDILALQRGGSPP